MIDKSEIDSMAQRLDVNTSNVQRDYSFGWLLSGLFQPSNPMSRLLVLKGGNCFRKAYFERARYSNDLDFGVIQDVDENFILAAVKEASEFAKQRSGIEFFVDDSTIRPKRVDGTFSALEARLYFKSFYGQHENLRIKVTMDVREFDEIYLPIQTRNLIHAYSDSYICTGSIRCLKLEELLAQKLKALMFRQHSPDLFDFVHAVFFQKALEIKRMEVLTTFFKHTIHQDASSARSLLLQLPFDVLKGFWEKYFDCPKDSFFTFDNAANWFRQAVSEIFSLGEPRFAGAENWAEMPYFGANDRAAIFEAGRLKRVMAIRYKGLDRLVEPYALAYKRARGRAPREYLYVYDKTGGADSGPSIKSLVAENLESLRISEEEFEPRYPIELTKEGGGYFGRSDFARPGRTSAIFTGRSQQPTARRTPGFKNPFAQTYKVQCPMCGKTFTRDSYKTALNAHADKYGNKCHGRVGYVV